MPEREDWIEADEAFNAAMDECDGSCPGGRYCREHGDLLPEDKEMSYDEALRLAMWGTGVVAIPIDQYDPDSDSDN